MPPRKRHGGGENRCRVFVVAAETCGESAEGLKGSLLAFCGAAHLPGCPYHLTRRLSMPFRVRPGLSPRFPTPSPAMAAAFNTLPTRKLLIGPFADMVHAAAPAGSRSSDVRYRPTCPYALDASAAACGRKLGVMEAEPRLPPSLSPSDRHAHAPLAPLRLSHGKATVAGQPCRCGQLIRADPSARGQVVDDSAHAALLLAARVRPSIICSTRCSW